MTTDTLALPPAKSDPPRDKLDRDYLEASWPAGIEPELARKKEYSAVLTIPPVVFGRVDRGRRVHGSPTLSVIMEAVAFAESECGPQAKRSLLTSQIIFFLVNVRNGRQMMHRAAALLLVNGLTHSDIRKLWPGQIKPSPLRRAKKDLRILQKGGAK